MSSAIAGGVASAIGTAASNAGWFVPMLVAAIAYFQYEEFVDPESKPINVATENLLTEYDFIVGEKNFPFMKIKNVIDYKINFFIQSGVVRREQLLQHVSQRLKTGMFSCWKLVVMKRKYRMYR